MAAPERNMNETFATTTTTIVTTTTDRIGPRRTYFRQRPQQTRNQPATNSTNIRRPRYQYIRYFLSGAAVAVTITQATQTAPRKEPSFLAVAPFFATLYSHRPLPRSILSLAYAAPTTDSSTHDHRRRKQARKNRPLSQ
jgi:hypothetical protein